MNIKLSINECHWKWSSITTTGCRKRTSGGTGGGYINRVSGLRSAILGGSNHIVSGDCSTVVGGLQNHVDGAYSSILGGSGNTVVAAFSYAGIFGQNINAQCSNMFHVDRLWISNLICIVGALTAIPPVPPGTVYARNMGATGCALFIR